MNVKNLLNQTNLSSRWVKTHKNQGRLSSERGKVMLEVTHLSATPREFIVSLRLQNCRLSLLWFHKRLWETYLCVCVCVCVFPCVLCVLPCYNTDLQHWSTSLRATTLVIKACHSAQWGILFVNNAMATVGLAHSHALYHKFAHPHARLTRTHAHTHTHTHI